MMHPRAQLDRDPDRPALIMAESGAALSSRALDETANRWAHLFRRHGLVPGDRVAIWMGNDPRFFALCWAAHNSGLYYVPISARLTGAEAAFIANDCSARLVVADARPELDGFAGARDGLSTKLSTGILDDFQTPNESTT